MKKFLSVLLAIVMLLSLVACGNKEQAPSPAAQTNESTTKEELKWPEKSVNFVIGFAAGGGADITARAVFQPFVEDILGQKFVISYMAGSNGEVSYTECAKTAKKDGYTIYWGAHPGMLTIPLTKASCQYTLDDIQPVARISTDPNIFIVNGDSQFNTMQDLVDYAKANPGKLTVGIGALNADDDLACEQWTNAAGIEVNKIVYAEGTTDRVTACMGKHIQVCVMNASEVTPYMGQVKILGLMAHDRIDFIKDVPTFEECGWKVYNGSDRGVIMPKGVDEEIVKKLSDAIGKAIENPECQKTLDNLNLIPAYLNYKDFEADLKAASANYAIAVANNKG